MADYELAYRWSLVSAAPVLYVRVLGSLLSDPNAIPAIIDRVHAYAEQSLYPRVRLAYDITRTERHLPLPALMRRAAPSPRVQRVAVVGAGARTDEMAVLIMSAAKGLDYPLRFFATLDEAAPFLHEQEAQTVLQRRGLRG